MVAVASTVDTEVTSIVLEMLYSALERGCLISILSLSGTGSRRRYVTIDLSTD